VEIGRLEGGRKKEGEWREESILMRDLIDKCMPRITSHAENPRTPCRRVLHLLGMLLLGWCGLHWKRPTAVNKRSNQPTGN